MSNLLGAWNRQKTAVATAVCLLPLIAACTTRGSTPTDPGSAVPAHVNGPLAFHPSPPEKPSAKDSDKTESDDPDEKKAQDKWDVNAPPGPKRQVTIDTDEGTWMSLDLSPDGKTIVFDLLGDLYSLPVSGGEATSLTSGMAWDMQPRFSPDGKWLAFTSDRDGGDNIWVLPVSGGDPRQISKEKFRLLSSPVWSPDGQFILARKHFTNTRSLGSGELWLYHLAGKTSGIALTKKPNDQKDVGEPAFSPDGRYVYYSQDVTPGKRFAYNKDPHAGIYAIQRLDREEGRTERFVGGPGGAVRPTPSPNGKQLAFVRRVGLKTALFVRDLKSGAETQVFDGLDRDMQETWAIHGVYPTMSWTPDNKAIVLWAGGALQRVSVASGKATKIPFHVKDTREVVKALRSPVEVHPKSFHTKMLRWVQVAPNGKSVIYQALGHIYIRNLPTGKAHRLTRANAGFEFYPSFSRDGKQVVYVHWDDEKLASLRIVPTAGGKGRIISSEPGHYLEPAFSPDGKTVVYRKGGGGWLTSPRWSAEQGLYAVSTRGGTPRLISRSGHAPHFGADSDRVFFVDTRREGKSSETVLKSIELSGAKEHTHLTSDKAVAFRVAPDGTWVAFQESFHAFVAPFPPTGKAYKVGPKSKALPIKRLTRDAGEYLHWSSDSRRVYWSLGAELFARDLKEAFDFIEGAPQELPEPAAKGTDIGFDLASDAPKTTFAFVGARVVTMKGLEVIDNGTVVVRGDRIEAVGPSNSTPVPAGAQSIDAKGMTIIPGLVDVHAHGSQGSEGITPQQNWLHYATLGFGVTTVHDPSNDTAEIFAAAELARAGEIVAPRIFSTGTILYGAKGSYTATVNNLEDARTHLRRMKAVGAFSVKSYNQPRRNQRQQLLTAARELDMMVVPEGGSTLQHNLNMVVDGHTGVEHAIPLAAGYKDLTQLWSATDVGYTPTVVVGYGGLWGENYWYAHTNVFEHKRLKTFVPPFAYEGRARRRTLASDGDWNHIRIAALCKKLLDAGVHIQLGAHGQREGLAAHWELWMFVQGGMTPHEALRAGTLHGAYYIGMDKDLGSIEAGKLADLAIIEGNPLKNIRDSDKVRYTMVGGRLFDARTMDEIGGKGRKRRPFFWQQSGGQGRPTSVVTHH